MDAYRRFRVIRHEGKMITHQQEMIGLSKESVQYTVLRQEGINPQNGNYILAGDRERNYDAILEGLEIKIEEVGHASR